jgi:hypothetical protein
MTVKHIEFSGIESRRYSKNTEYQGSVSAHTTINITNVQAANPNQAMVDFRYNVVYNIGGIVNLEGTAICECDSKTAIEAWTSTHKLPDKLNEEIEATIMYECFVHSLSYSYKVGLPFDDKHNIPRPKIGPMISYSSLEARRFSKREERFNQLQIGHGATIVNVYERNEKEANIEFRYTVNYGHVGVINMDGNLIFPGKGAELAFQWGQKRQLPKEITEQIINIILSEGSFEALVSAKLLNLPPPIKIEIPRVKLGEPPKKPTSQGGMEVA